LPPPEEPRSAADQRPARREIEDTGESGARGESTTDYSPGTGAQLKRLVIGFAVVLAVAFLITFVMRWFSAHRLASETRVTVAEAPPVDVVTVGRGAAGRPLTLPGETAAWYESLIYARVSGYVGTWSADIGDHVAAGQVLATIDTPELDADYAAAKAKLAAAQAQVKVRQAEAEFAASTYARWRDSPKGVVSEQEREDKKAGQASSAAALDAARAQVSLAQADVERLAAFEQFKRVTAPYAGTITERRIDIGNLVNAGSSSSTPLYRMAQDDPMRVFVAVPQSASSDLMRDGVAVRITSNTLAKPIAGKITRTSSAVDPQARTFRVEIDVPNPDNTLVSGMYVEVGFLLDNSGLLQVPAAALVFRSGQPQVAIVDSNDTVHLHNVTIARDDGNTVELQSGVNAGEHLVLNLGSQVVDGEKVRMRGASAARTVAAARVP
jgi:RND family efflux transporter MFP subunit